MSRPKKQAPAVEQRALDPDEEAWVRLFLNMAIDQLMAEKREAREVGDRKGKAA